MPKWFFRRSAACCLALMLPACAGVSTDPGEGGLLGGIKGLSTGEYDRRVDERKGRLASIQDYNRQVEQENLDLKKRNETLNSRISRVRKKIDAISADLHRIQTQGSRAPRRTDLTKLKRRLAALDAKRRRLNEQLRLGKIDQQTLEQEFKRLDHEAKELEQLSQHLAQ